MFILPSVQKPVHKHASKCQSEHISWIIQHRISTGTTSIHLFVALLYFVSTARQHMHIHVHKYTQFARETRGTRSNNRRGGGASDGLLHKLILIRIAGMHYIWLYFIITSALRHTNGDSSVLFDKKISTRGIEKICFYSFFLIQIFLYRRNKRRNKYIYKKKKMFSLPKNFHRYE